MTAAACPQLFERASAPYRAAGRFAFHFARGKLRGDPAFPALLAQGWLAHSRRVLDLGCGQGLLFAWLLAARDCHAAGEWPAGWPPPPCCESLIGIEMMGTDTRRAREAIGAAARFVEGDLRNVTLGAADAVVMLDVLHYLEPQAQVDLLARVRTALQPEGVFLLRVGDAAGGLGFRLSQWVDRLVLRARGHRAPRLHCRTVPEWRTLLASHGFRSEAHPLSQGTPFANVLLVARPV